MDALSCLAPPPPALLAASFADAAIRWSTIMSPPDSSSSSLSLSAAPAPAPHHQYSPLLLPTPYHVGVAATCCDSVLVADSPKLTPGRRHHHHHHQALAPAGGRAGKRRSRASKRAPTTYISTDPANFRLMVQQITGAQAQAEAEAEVGTMDMLQATAALDAAVLLAADASAAGSASASASAYGNLPLVLPGDEQQQQPCFPTLDSWNVMYERNGELL